LSSGRFFLALDCHRPARGTVFGAGGQFHMNHESNLPGSLARWTSSVRGLGSVVLFCSLSLPSAAQAPRVVVSTTDDVAPAVGIPFSVLDGDLVTVQAGQPVAPFFAGGQFQATCGFTPGDIDAFTRLPGSSPGRAGSIVFSLLSNEGGFLDGDVLILANGGRAGLLVSELDIATALGATGVSVDVDALTYDAQGRILFSLTDSLSASALGPILDGDILRLEPGLAGVTRLFTEAEVQTGFSQATGLADAILDTQALEWSNGEMWVAVQSPSRHDGSIIAIGAAPRIVTDENDLGLGGTELDAVGAMRPGDEIPVFHLSADFALPGDQLHVEVRGTPGAKLVVLASGGVGYVPVARFPGFGAAYLDRLDPWLNALLTARALPLITLDGAGTFARDFRLPSGTEFGLGFGGELGWSFQLMDFATKQFSAPVRVQKL
jgi:hypothetical protein